MFSQRRKSIKFRILFYQSTTVVKWVLHVIKHLFGKDIEGSHARRWDRPAVKGAARPSRFYSQAPTSIALIIGGS